MKYYGSKDIRYILQNAGKIKADCRCIQCNGTGRENWNEEGEDVRPGSSTNPDRINGECEKCDGIGFILPI